MVCMMTETKQASMYSFRRFAVNNVIVSNLDKLFSSLFQKCQKQTILRV